MIEENGLFSQWTFDSFAPGSILRTKYNAFREIHFRSTSCFALLARIERIALTNAVVDWSQVVELIESLIAEVRSIIDKLQSMNPVEFMDAQDWANKISFYSRLVSAPNPVSMAPSYFDLCSPAGWRDDWSIQFQAKPSIVLCITPSLVQYFMEVNDLRDRVDSILRKLDMQDVLSLAKTSQTVGALLAGARLPERLERELEIAAVDLAPGGLALDVRAYLEFDGKSCVVLERYGIKADELREVWREAITARYSSAALTWRLECGLADEEVPLTFLALVQGQSSFEPMAQEQFGQHGNALADRLCQVLPYVTELYVFDSSDSLRPDRCKSLHDLVCLCFERGLNQIFSFAGVPGKGMAAIKQLRMNMPMVINVFNLGDAFFPSVAGKSVITVEDLRSVPAWSLFMGLGSPLVSWIDDRREASDHTYYSSHAVLAQLYMHCTLRLSCNLFMVECECDPERDNGFIRFTFKGGNGANHERLQRLEVMKRILVSEGFVCRAVGDYLSAGHDGLSELALQRYLVSLGLLIAWVHLNGTVNFGLQSVQESQKRFNSLLHEHLSR